MSEPTAGPMVVMGVSLTADGEVWKRVGLDSYRASCLAR
jgi:hypothetical protein